MLRVEDMFRAVMKNAAILIGGRVTNAVLGLAAFGLAGRSLGRETFGVLMVVYTLAQAAADVARFQSWQTVLQYGAKPLADGNLPDLQRVIRFSCLLDLISAVSGVALGVAATVLIGGVLHLPAGVAPAAAAYMSCIACMVTATPTGILRLYGRFDLLAGETNVCSLVWLVGGVIATARHAGFQGYILVWWAGTFATFAYLSTAAFVVLARQGALKGFSWRVGHLTQGFPEIWRFAMATHTNATLGLSFTHVSTLIVSALLNPAQAALWRVAKLFSEAIAAPAEMITSAMYPEFARLAASGQNHVLGRLALRIGGTVGAMATLLLVVTFLFGHSILRLTMGEAFTSAAPVMTWLTAAAIVGIWALPLEPMLISTGHASAAVLTRLIVSALYLLSLAPLVGRLGVVGGGIAAVGASVLLGVGMMLGVMRWYRDPRSGMLARTPP